MSILSSMGLAGRLQWRAISLATNANSSGPLEGCNRIVIKNKDCVCLCRIYRGRKTSASLNVCKSLVGSLVAPPPATWWWWFWCWAWWWCELYIWGGVWCEAFVLNTAPVFEWLCECSGFGELRKRNNKIYECKGYIKYCLLLFCKMVFIIILFC